MRAPGFLRRSLRSKVTALVVATTLLALTIAAVALLYYNVRDYRETEVAQLRTQAEILGRASAAALAFNDAKEAAKDLGILGANPDVELAALYDAQGKLFATYLQQGATRMEFPSQADTPGLVIEGTRVSIVHPIIEEGQRLGTVLVRARYGLPERLYAYLGILGLAILGAFAAALLLSAWLQRAVTAPLLGLADAARRVVERRDFSVRAGETTEDEIGVLARAMNAMLAGLEREIAERRSAEEALRAADRRKDEFLATLAHELRNPLAPVRNAIHLMQAAPADSALMTEARGMIDRQVRQMVRLIDDLLDVSRITTGKLALRRERVELRAVANAALEAVQPLVRERGHELVVDLPSADLSINVDATRLSQVFLNLLNNAAKFTPQGGRIEFSVRVEDRSLVAHVRDNGIGIAADMISEVFEMFAQADRSLERTTGGLGVGLALSRRLVDLHGGTIEAHSAGLGRGAEFVVRIPAVSAESARSAREAGDGQGGPHTPRRVLIVDDNRDFADSLARVLQHAGHEVRMAYDGIKGLEAAKQMRPHVALVDLGMPGLNGYDLARRLRSDPATAPVVLVAVTGWGQPRDRELGKEAGFDAYLVKPVDVELVQSLLARV